MGVIRRQIPWTKKPPAYQKINNRYKILSIFNGDNINAIDNFVATSTGTPTKKISSIGESILLDSVNDGIYITSKLNTQKSSLSIMWVGEFLSEADQDGSLGGVTYDDSNVTPYIAIELKRKYISNTGSVYLSWNNTSTYNYLIDYTVRTTGKFIIIGTVVSGEQKLYIKEIDKGESNVSSTISGDIDYGTKPRIEIGDTLNNRNPNASCALQVIFDGVLSDAEINSLLKNPWQVYQHQTQIIPFSTGTDTTAPILSSPTATATGPTTADGSVATDETNGTGYALISTNSTETAATIKASGSSVSVTASPINFSFTGLSPNTTYYIHYVQDDTASNESNVVKSASITTDAQVYVDPSAGTNGVGTSASPFNTFAGMSWVGGTRYDINAVTTLNETITIGASGTSGNPITIGKYGSGADPVISSGTANIINGNTKSYITLENLKVTATASVTALNFGNSNNCTFTNVVVSGASTGLSLNKANNITITGGDYSNNVNGIKGNSSGGTATHTISITGGTVVSSNSDDGIQFTAGTSADQGDVYGITITGASVYSNSGNGINIVSNESASAKVAGYACWDLQITNNTVYSNTKTGIRIRNVLGSQDSKTNSNFSSNTAYSNCTGDTPGNMWFGACNNSIIELNDSRDAKTNNTYDGSNIYVDNYSSQVIVRRNKCYDALGGSGISTGCGIQITSTDAIEVYGNLCYGNKRGIWANENLTAFTGTNKIYNNTCYNNSESQLGWKDNVTGSTFEFKNNIGSGGKYGFYTDGTTTQTNDYNDIHNASTAAYQGVTAGSNSITTDPKFVDAANDNFKLYDSSGAVGSALYVSTITDYDGLSMDISNPIMGAYFTTINSVSFPIETDSAFNSAILKNFSLLQASENNSGLNLTGNKKYNLNQISELDNSQSVNLSKYLQLGLTNTLDAGQSITIAGAISVNQSSEVELSQQIIIWKKFNLSQSQETDLSQSVSTGNILNVGITTESELSNNITVSKFLNLTQTNSSESSLQITKSKNVGISQSFELNYSLSINLNKTVVLNQTSESDIVLSLAISRYLDIGLTQEIDLSLNLVSGTSGRANSGNQVEITSRLNNQVEITSRKFNQVTIQ